MNTPAVWSSNIIRNFERILEWSDCVIIMCDINSQEYDFYKSKCVYKIEFEDLQNAITSWGPNFGAILQWIVTGINSIRNNNRIPEHCLIDSIEISEFEETWEKHINHSRQILDKLKNKMLNLKSDVKEKIKTFSEEESDDEYSSYSDYSESTSSDEDEDEDDDNYESMKKRVHEEKKRENRKREEVDDENESNNIKYDTNYSEEKNTHDKFYKGQRNIDITDENQFQNALKEKRTKPKK